MLVVDLKNPGRSGQATGAGAQLSGEGAPFPPAADFLYQQRTAQPWVQQPRRSEGSALALERAIEASPAPEPRLMVLP